MAAVAWHFSNSTLRMHQASLGKCSANNSQVWNKEDAAEPREDFVYMNKQNATYAYNEVVLSHEKEYGTRTRYNMDEPQSTIQSEIHQRQQDKYWMISSI